MRLLSFAFVSMMVLPSVHGHLGHHHHEHEAHEEHDVTDGRRLQEKGRSCGTPDLTEEEQLQDELNMAAYIENVGMQAINEAMSGVINVDVYWHTIYTTSGTGRTPQDKIEKSMEVLNRAFAGEPALYNACSNFQYGAMPASPFRFTLKQIHEHENDGAFNLDGSTSNTFRASVRVGDCSTLNIFTGNTNSLGFAYLPSSCNNNPANNPLDAVMLRYTALADGSIGAYDEGDTATHEVGHWLGLRHTFNGGCTGGDFVSDTPAESSPAFGCPIGRDTCGEAGVDPIHNFMDYSDDCCMYKFTEGQIARMIAQVGLYRNLFVTSGTDSPSAFSTISHSPSNTLSASPSSSPTISRAPTRSPTQKPVKTRPTKPPKGDGGGGGGGEKPTKPPKNGGGGGGGGKGKMTIDCLQNLLRGALGAGRGRN